jgi:hypothetical protein
MFQSVRPNSPIYIFHKTDNPALEIGYVLNQPMQKPKYQIPQTFGQPQEMVVDITAKVGVNTLNFNALPAQLDIADSYSNGENIVISTSKEAMNAEVLSNKQKSIDIIESVPKHKELLPKYDAILGQLNPEYAEKQTQKEEMNDLKNQVNMLTSQVGRLVEALMPKNNLSNEQSLGNH